MLRMPLAERIPKEFDVFEIKIVRIELLECYNGIKFNPFSHTN